MVVSLMIQHINDNENVDEKDDDENNNYAREK